MCCSYIDFRKQNRFRARIPYPYTLKQESLNWCVASEKACGLETCAHAIKKMLRMNSALSAVGNAPVKSSMLLGFVRHKKNLESLDPEPKSHWQTCNQDACQCLPNSPCCLGKWTRPTEKRMSPLGGNQTCPDLVLKGWRWKRSPGHPWFCLVEFWASCWHRCFCEKQIRAFWRQIARPNQCSALHPASCFLLGKWLDWM